MTILLPQAIAERLTVALRRAREREIGGILFGQHLEGNTFRVIDVTIQRTGGTAGSFIRRLRAALRALGRFFEQSQRDYQRFNYLGEWHSHPSFEPIPSLRDHGTMREMIEDPTTTAHFVVLLVLRLDSQDLLTGTVTGYTKNSQLDGILTIEVDSVDRSISKNDETGQAFSPVSPVGTATQPATHSGGPICKEIIAAESLGETTGV
jgi:proteasome lid subunit RPN8/RPN11